MTEPELVDYFNEHVLYELLMLRYSKQCLEKGGTQLHWNAMFSAFNVSARNLYDFLNNKGRGGSVDVKAYDLYRKDTTRDSTSGISKTMELLNAQCFHMSEKRFSDTDKKIKLDRIRETFEWIESNIGNLLKSFKDDFLAELKPERADLDTQQLGVIALGLTGPLSSSFPTIIYGHTGISQAMHYEVKPKK
jgi:hypothetical protein